MGGFCGRLWPTFATPSPIADVQIVLEFMVLTATHSNQIRVVAWDDIQHDVWTILASRMKAKREHQFPFSSRALKILEEARE